MRINPHLGFPGGHLPPSAGFRGPNSSLLSSELGANRLLEMRLLETVTFLSHAGQRAHRLNDAIANLPSAFNPRTAISSNPGVLQIASFSGQGVTDTNFVIHQIATTQRNDGTALTANAKVEAEGLHKFELEVDGRTHEISFKVEGEVTNRQFQQMMADAINNANLGINATITASGNNTTLRLETGTTGPGIDGGPRFTIRDIEGEAVALTGTGDITQEAQNAVFTVNGGEERTQATNRVDLGNGLVVNLLASSEGEVRIFMGQDRLAMRSAVRDVVNQFNALLEAAHVNAGDRNTRQLIRDLNGAARMSRRDLDRLGIQIGRDGMLTINETALNAAMDDGSLDRFFRGGDNGRPSAFVTRLGRIADSVIRNPMRHISPHARNLPNFNAALNAVNNPPSNTQNAQGQQAPSPFDMPDDLMSILFDALR